MNGLSRDRMLEAMAQLMDDVFFPPQGKEHIYRFIDPTYNRKSKNRVNVFLKAHSGLVYSLHVQEEGDRLEVQAIAG